MKKSFVILSLLLLTGVACDRHEPKVEDQKAKVPVENRYEPDNTGKNVRDRNENAKTPGEQSESQADRTVVQNIRKALVEDDSLSTNGKNIKVIVIDGAVTLRGPVATPRERERIIRKIHNLQGIVSLDDQLEVLQNN